MPCGPSIFAGLDPATLQTWLTSAQLALLQLQTGAKVASAGYTQGDGAKNISYRQADIGSLTVLIRQLQFELGIIDRPRRAMRVWF